MLKKLILFALAAMLCLSVAGCGGKPSVAPDREIIGTVTDAGMNTTTIKTADGIELSFATADAQITMKDGLLLGDIVAITFTGEIKNDDASGVVVVKMTDGADNSANPLRTAQNAPASSDAQSEPANGEKTITGTVTDATMNVTTIQTEDGLTLSFATGDAPKNMADGLILGDIVTILYTGEINGSDASAVTVVSMTDGADNRANPLRALVEQSVTGTVSAIGMSAVTIMTADGTELSFLTESSENTVTDGPQEGQTITVVYTGTISGTDTSTAAVLRLMDAE